MLSNAVLEITVAGIGGFIWLSLLVGSITGTGGLRADLLRGWEAIAVIVFGGVVYALGAIIDRLADTGYREIEKTLTGKHWLKRLEETHVSFPEAVNVMRLRLMEEDTPRTRFLEYQRSRVRIARGLVFNLVMLLPVGTLFLALRTDAGVATIVLLALTVTIALGASLYAMVRIGNAHEARLRDAYLQWLEQHPDRSERKRKLPRNLRAGAVCYRSGEGTLEFLLVRTKDGGYWTFPKGHVEATDASASDAAAREAREEAGVEGRASETPLTSYMYPPSANEGPRRWVDVEAYLLEATSIDSSLKEGRARDWFTPAQAIVALGENRARVFRAEHERVVKLAVEALTR